MTKLKIIENRLEELKQDYGKLSTKELEVKYDANYSTIRKVLYKFDIIDSNRQCPIKHKYLHEHVEEFKEDWINRILTKDELEKKYFCSYNTLGSFARQMKIKRKMKRETVDANSLIYDVVNDRYTYKELSKIYGIGIQAIRLLLKDYNIDHARDNRKYQFNEHYFDIIDNEHKSYWLGFIYADGYHNLERYSLTINLQERDIDILWEFYKDIECEKIVNRYYNSDYKKFYANISVQHPHLSETLLKQGVPTNKSFKIIFPSDDIVPYELKRHFIRGYLDGDGCISVPKDKSKVSWSIIGNYNFLNGLKKYIEENIYDYKLNLIKHSQSNIYSISKGGRFVAEIFLDWIYKDATIFLQRKYDKYLEIKKYNKEMKNMKNLKEMKKLINEIHKASIAYYKFDKPIYTDKQYDDMYDRLEKLEKETGVILSDSPTQKVQGEVLECLEKVKHGKQMLSANKTKDITEIKKFIGNKPCIMSWKEDGLTIVLRYKNGVLNKAITRGKDGLIGEDVTHTMRMCKNIPLKIPCYKDIEIRGECVISWSDFHNINENLEKPHSHPRNLAAGSVRQLNATIAKNRNIKYKAFELVQDYLYEESKINFSLKKQIMSISESLKFLTGCGFDVVEHDFVTKDNLEDMIKKYEPLNYDFPVDGLIFVYDDYLYGKSLGETSHHPLNMIALKWKDELYETTLEDIEWSTSKTGLINPVAVFSPVDMDGAVTTRATLHNVSYIEDLELGVGDTIEVYKANMVIPKVHDNLTRSNTWEIPDKCPDCGGKVEVRNENGSKTLHCLNENCPAKLLGKLVHFVSKNAMNIEKMSEVTLQKLLELKYVTSFKDIYSLSKYRTKLYIIDGFGKKSVDTILSNIDKSRNTTLERFLYSLSIPLIGRSVSKDISKYCHDSIDEFSFIMENTSLEFASIDGIGVAATTSLDTWWNENRDMFYELKEEMNFVQENNEKSNSVNLSGKTFVITGALNHFSNRDELKTLLENMGAKVSGSVSKNSFALICNDKDSNTGKSKKAKELGVQVWTEDELLDFIKTK